MKKLIVPAALLLVVACAQPFLKEKDNSQITMAVKNYPPTVQQENTSHTFTPEFTALNIPEEMKQHFRINANASQVIVGESGTMILIPENAFMDANGNAVSGKVKMEIVEGIKTADILKMNLGTMSDQGPLETGGMIYLNVFSESGDTLQMAKGKQLEIEMPTDNKKPGMQLWEGITNKEGSISWTDPQPLKEELRQIPLSALEERSEGEIKDIPLKMDERTRIANVFMVNDGMDAIWLWNSADSTSVLTANGTGLEIAKLTDEKFENTNIATAEFRSRLPFINQACDSRVMLCYTENPTRALWKSDKEAADILEKSHCALADVFRQLANLKQDKINPSDPNTVAALNEARDKAVKKYSDNVRAAQTYSSYSFGMKKLGWANVDCLSYGGKRMFLNAHVDGAKADDNVRASLIVPARGIFIPGYKRPNGDFSFTHGEQEQQASYPDGDVGYILVRSGDNMKFDLKKIIFGQNRVENLSLHAGTEEDLALAMGNEPPKKAEAEKEIDDWYTKTLRSGGGCLCEYETRNK